VVAGGAAALGEPAVASERSLPAVGDAAVVPAPPSVDTMPLVEWELAVVPAAASAGATSAGAEGLGLSA
jgi:hypothetical protein